MKTINFIGQGDKTDLMLYIAKLVSAMNNKVLYIDSVTTQKCRYIVPAIKYDDDEYITTYEDMDVAIGFESHGAIIGYLNENGEDFNQYDYVFIDINSKEMCELFNVKNANTTFVVSSYDKYEVAKTIGLLEEMNENNEYISGSTINRIYLFSLLNTADEKFINYSFDNREGIKYAEKNIFLPLDEGDRSILIQNQYAEKIILRDLSKDYKKGLVDIMARIMPDENINLITRTFKNVERMV